MKRVLIIGASSGIGAATSLRLAQGDCSVILHGRDEERLGAVRDRAGNNCSLITGDVIAWAEDPKRIPEIEPVDAIVWSAGICELAPGQMLGLKAIRRTLAVNLEAPLVVLSHFYRKGVIKDGGTIVLLGSEAAHDAGEGFSIYAASKGGLAAAARVLAKEYQRRNIGLHCLEPGTVDTPMTRKLIETFGGTRDAGRGRLDETSPKLGDPRFVMVQPEDVAREVAALLEG